MKLKYGRKELKKRNGFTLVEMVLVVTILGILSGTAFMKFGGVQDKAKENADDVTVANIVTAVNLAVNDKVITQEDTDILKTLKAKGYISSIPEPQTVNEEFTIVFDNTKGLTISAGEKVFYVENES